MPLPKPKLRWNISHIKLPGGTQHTVRMLESVQSRSNTGTTELHFTGKQRIGLRERCKWKAEAQCSDGLCLSHSLQCLQASAVPGTWQTLGYYLLNVRTVTTQSPFSTFVHHLHLVSSPVLSMYTVISEQYYCLAPHRGEGGFPPRSQREGHWKNTFSHLLHTPNLLPHPTLSLPLQRSGLDDSEVKVCVLLVPMALSYELEEGTPSGTMNYKKIQSAQDLSLGLSSLTECFVWATCSVQAVVLD